MSGKLSIARFLAVWSPEREESVDLPGSGGGGCPGFVEFDNGDIGIVGKFVDADELNSSDGCRLLVAADERCVVVPRAILDDAVKRLSQ